MVDRSRSIDDRQWTSILDEIEWHVRQLRTKGREARARIRGLPAGGDGYPRSSMPESSIASGRLSDPVGETVVSLAGGRGGERDSWPGVRDEVTAHVRQMERETNDAVVRLRGALTEAHKSMPEAPPDPSREVCQSCGTPKQVATSYGKRPRGWVVATARCESCANRIKKQDAQVMPLRSKVQEG